MEPKPKIIAYIDAANLHKRTNGLGWSLDYRKFRSWIRQKYGVENLVNFWLEKSVSCTVVSPAPLKKCSILLKKTGVPILCLDDVKHKLSHHQT